MKKNFFLFLISIFALPLFVFAEGKCNPAQVVLKSIAQTSRSENVVEKSEPTIEDNKINIDIQVESINDFIMYEFTVENNSDEQVVFDEDTIKNDKDHFEYSIEYEDNSNIIEPHDEKDVYLTVAYKKEVDASEYENGVYRVAENKVFTTITEEPASINPYTASFIILLLIALVVLSDIMIFKVFLKKKKVSALILIIALTIIPFKVFACTFGVEVNSCIEVVAPPELQPEPEPEPEPEPDPEPEIVGPVDFATDSWDVIITAVQEGDTDAYNVGDTKEINLGTTFGTHPVRIANKSTPSVCSGTGFSQTACGFVLEFTDIISNIVWLNSTGYSNGGWRDSNARTYVNSTIYNALPADLKAGIIDTFVVSSHNSSESTNFTSTDKLYMLAMREIYGDSDADYRYKGSDTAYEYSRQLDFYNSLGIDDSNYSSIPPKLYNGVQNASQYWWTRTARNNSSSSVYCVFQGGGYNGTSQSQGVSPAFRIG